MQLPNTRSTARAAPVTMTAVFRSGQGFLPPWDAARNRRYRNQVTSATFAVAGVSECRSITAASSHTVPRLHKGVRAAHTAADAPPADPTVDANTTTKLSMV